MFCSEITSRVACASGFASGFTSLPTHTPAEFLPTRQHGAANPQSMIPDEAEFFNMEFQFFNIHFPRFQHETKRAS